MAETDEEKKWIDTRLDEIKSGMFSEYVKFEGWEGPTSLRFRGPVHKLVNLMLSKAIKERASDIYFELSESEFMVRYVADRMLLEMIPPPRRLYKEITEDLEARFGIWGVEKKKVEEGSDKIEVGEDVVRLRKFDSGDFISATIAVKREKMDLNLMKIASNYGDAYHLALRAS